MKNNSDEHDELKSESENDVDIMKLVDSFADDTEVVFNTGSKKSTGRRTSKASEKKKNTDKPASKKPEPKKKSDKPAVKKPETKKKPDKPMIKIPEIKKNQEKPVIKKTEPAKSEDKTADKKSEEKNSSDKPIVKNPEIKKSTDKSVIKKPEASSEAEKIPDKPSVKKTEKENVPDKSADKKSEPEKDTDKPDVKAQAAEKISEIKEIIKSKLSDESESADTRVLDEKTQRILKKYQQKYPGAKVAEFKDGVDYVLIPAIAGVILMIIGIVIFIISGTGAAGERDFFEKAQIINGTVAKVNTPDSGKTFKVDYSYRYDDKSYKSSENISSAMAEILSLTGKAEDKGKYIPIYIDPEDPGHSALEYSPGSPLYIILIVSVIGLAVVVLCAVRVVQCKKGMMILYKNDDGKKIVKIK